MKLVSKIKHFGIFKKTLRRRSKMKMVPLFVYIVKSYRHSAFAATVLHDLENSIPKWLTVVCNIPPTHPICFTNFWGLWFGKLWLKIYVR